MELKDRSVYKGGTCDARGTEGDYAVELPSAEGLVTETVTQDDNEISRAAIAVLLGIGQTLNVAG
jgi:hypothetical protein